MNSTNIELSRLTKVFVILISTRQKSGETCSGSRAMKVVLGPEQVGSKLGRSGFANRPERSWKRTILAKHWSEEFNLWPHHFTNVVFVLWVMYHFRGLLYGKCNMFVPMFIMWMVVGRTGGSDIAWSDFPPLSICSSHQPRTSNEAGQEPESGMGLVDKVYSNGHH